MAVTSDFFDPNTGVLTASATMAGFVCRRSGQVASAAKFAGRGTYASSISIDVAGFTNPVIALRSEGYAAALLGTRNTTQRTFISDAPVGTVFSFYIFEFTQALPAHSAEFQVVNESTQAIMFSSRYWPMKLIGGIAMTENTAPPPFTAIGGAVLAHAESNIGGHSRVEEAFCYDGGVSADGAGPGCNDVRGRQNGKLYGARTSGNQLTALPLSFDDVMVSYGTYDQYTQVYGAGWVVPNLIMVIDVTNIPLGVNFF